MIKVFSRTVIGLSLALMTATTFAADKAELAANAPDSYVVKKGDTLWAISGVFLRDAWRWPEVWKMNQDQIRNPHLIYPGQIVVLDRNSNTLSMGRQVSGGVNGVEKLSPQVYSKDVISPIASIPLDAIRPFLTEPLVSETEDSPTEPTVVAIDQERVLAGAGDVIYAKNLNGNPIDAWHVYRRAKVLKDPVSKQVLGYEAQYVATARVTIPANGDKAAEMRVMTSKHEIVPSDRLQPAGKSELLAAPPHAPMTAIAASVVSIYGGVDVGGRNSVIAVSAGKNAGLEPGHVLAISRNNGSTIYRGDSKAEVVNMPDTRTGLLYIFRVFNRVGYGLIMEASGPVKIGDKVANP
ncbi:LysM peptidoglycan-binding domain-containing protein [Uliginosibacterium flavum]|uniref:LysM peptidoglycan-binding domain-containing protein n=1 Tax=Uliginosibacterium flavum TaxID=1396831 RepID=A0ABV2TLN4_9RHOO